MRELDNLVAIGQLKRGDVSRGELIALLNSGRARLRDADNTGLSLESRFDLAYNSAHALALTALRFRGYRSDHRHTVFQLLEHTAGVPPGVWRVLAKAHGERNLREYEGGGAVDERLLADLITSAKALELAVRALICQ